MAGGRSSCLLMSDILERVYMEDQSLQTLTRFICTANHKQGMQSKHMLNTSSGPLASTQCLSFMAGFKCAADSKKRTNFIFFKHYSCFE